MTTLHPGSRLGKFEIVEHLGSGNFGAVYRAQDTSLGVEVALKVLFRQLVSSSSAESELNDEARRAAAIQSDYVVGVKAFEVLDGQPVIVYEYIPGSDLRKAECALSFTDKLEVGRQLLLGVKAIHDVGIVHRDLKPENIKWTPDKHIKIIDFGLSGLIREAGDNPVANMAGTVPYMSPERLSGDPISSAADIFSYGVILYELFVGQRPFESDFAEGIIYSILHEEPKLPSSRRADIPRWLDALIMKSLQKDLGDRFAGADEMLELFEPHLQGLPSTQVFPEVSARRPSVTVVDLMNLTGETSWDRWCIGFRDDLMGEISRRIDATISAEPATSVTSNIRQLFQKCRSDYLISGSLLVWEEQVKLTMMIYVENGEKIAFSDKFIGGTQDLLELLQRAAETAAAELARLSGRATIPVEQARRAHVTAYDYYWRGIGYYMTNKPDDLESAERLFRKALEIDPEFALAHSGLSDVFAFEYMAFYKHSVEQLERARAEAERSLEIDPHLPEAHRSLGRCCLFAGDLEGARKSLEQAVAINPRYATGLRTLAWFHESQGELREALEYARRAHALAPTDLETLLLMGLIHMEQHKYTLALATLQRAIELGPDYGRAYYNLGQVYAKLGVLDQSLEYYAHAIKYKGDPNSHVEAGYVNILTGDLAAAKLLLETAVQEGFLDFVALYYLGLIERLSGEERAPGSYFERAAQALEKYEQEDAGNQHLRAYRALIASALGDEETAIDHLRRLERDHVADGEILYTMARSYAVLKKADRARSILERAASCPGGPGKKEIELDPHFSRLESVIETS